LAESFLAVRGGTRVTIHSQEDRTLFARSCQHQARNPSALNFKFAHYLIRHWFPNQPRNLPVQPKRLELPLQPDAPKGSRQITASNPTLRKASDMDALLNQGKGDEGQLIRVLQRAEAPSNIQTKDTSKIRWWLPKHNVVRPSLNPVAQVANDVKVSSEVEFLATIIGFFR
jgi:hypothetical protein